MHKMKMEVKSSEIMKEVLETYKNIKTTRPYSSKDKWYVLLGLEINKKYNISLTKNDLYKMHVLENQEQDMKRRSKKPVLVKRHIANEFLPARKPLPLERKRTFVEEENARDSRKSVFDRLYQQRPKPDQDKAELVKERSKKKVTFLTDKYYSPNKSPTVFYEPFCKKICKRRESLISKMNSTVFERLYSERKQLNCKKLTDSEKRELYMESQREEIRRAQAAWASMSQSIQEGNDVDEHVLTSSSECDFNNSWAFRSSESVPNNLRAFRSSESDPKNSRAFTSRESVPDNSRSFRSSESGPSNSRAFTSSSESLPKNSRAYTSRESVPNYKLVYTSSSESVHDNSRASTPGDSVPKNSRALSSVSDSGPNTSRAMSSSDTVPNSSMSFTSSTESVPCSSQPFTSSTESVPSSTYSCKDSGVDNLDDFEPRREVIYPRRHFVPTPEQELTEMLVKLLRIAAAKEAAKSS